MILVHKSKGELGFEIIGEAYQAVTDWSYHIDERIFKQQLSTGLDNHNQPLDDYMLAVMHHVDKEGKILPYYGAGGSRGACTYRFRLYQTEVRLVLEHGETKDTTNFSYPFQQVSKPNRQKGRLFNFSPLRFLVKESLPEAWSGESPKSIVCPIYGREYEKLKNWSNWIDSDALSERYQYSFSQVSLGATGYVTKIKDIQNDAVIDITDYDDW